MRVFLILAILSNVALTENLWKCSLSSEPVYTNRPTQSVDASCREFHAKRGSFNRNSWVPEIPAAVINEKGSLKSRPYLQFNYIEQSEGERCKLWGFVFSRVKSALQLEIEREGKRDVYTLPWSTGFKGAPWSLSLEGACKEPQVKLVDVRGE